MTKDTMAFPQAMSAGSMAIAEGGLTMRDWFAGMALCGILANNRVDATGQDNITIAAFSVADAMMINRNGNDAPNGWIYYGPDGEWHWSAYWTNYESVEDQRPATSLEKNLMAAREAK